MSSGFLFKSQDFLEKAEKVLTSPLMAPSGDTHEAGLFSGLRFSQWLCFQLEAELLQNPLWLKCHPVLLGSWARQELCLKSDLDVLFCGDEADVFSLISDLQERGYKLRYRVPANPSDWTEGVEIYDILALLSARPLTEKGALELYTQQKKIWSQKSYLAKSVLLKLKSEREERSRRFDSLANYLEPQIKQGPGALRDLEQGLQVYRLFSERVQNSQHALDVFQYYKNFYLTLRHKLHLKGGGDLFSSHLQHELYQWLGYSNHAECMRQLQRGLSRVSFYSDWILAQALASVKSLHKIESYQLHGPADLWEAFAVDAGPLMQKRVRSVLEPVYLKMNKEKQLKARRDGMKFLTSLKRQDTEIVAIFKSRLIDKIFPEIVRLVGHVQHDQYHRFTVDTHILQNRRELQRVYLKPKILGPLAEVAGSLKKRDWEVLSWLTLYHDIGKGLKGDHSLLGAEFASSDLRALKIPLNLRNDIVHLVRCHLDLSQAAFKKNPNDFKTWEELTAKGIQGDQLKRLAVFTAIDIRSTNPEAWNDWKAQLLAGLTQRLLKSDVQASVQLAAVLSKKNVPLKADSLDSLLVESFSPEVFVRDWKKVNKAFKRDIEIYRDKNRNIWVRFYEPKDSQGVLKSIVQSLYSAGCNIRHAAIHTTNSSQVYDWFQVSIPGRLESFKKRLSLMQVQGEKALPSVRFDQVEWVQQSEGRGSISFKALDQQGLLLNAVSVLSDLNLNIRGARIHTWGRQVEDVFDVEWSGEAESLIQEIRRRVGN